MNSFHGNNERCVMASVTQVSMVFDDDSSAPGMRCSAPRKSRPIYERLFAELGRYSPRNSARSEQLSNTFSERGVTFAHSGEERPFPLDVVPRLIGRWSGTTLEGDSSAGAGLEAFLPTSTATVASSPSTSFRIGRHVESALLSPGLRRRSAERRAHNGRGDRPRARRDGQLPDTGR